MNATHEVGDARAEVAEAMRSRLDTLCALQRIAGDEDVDEFSNDELLKLDIGYGVAGPLPYSQVIGEADERLSELPLAVEATTTFEVVLATGGPDERLCFECDAVEQDRADGRGGIVGSRGYEIRRAYFRYSWTGSAEVELFGEDREVAEEFARRVVPELVE